MFSEQALELENVVVWKDLGQNLDGPVRVRPINDGSGSHRAFQVAYERKNVRIGILHNLI